MYSVSQLILVYVITIHLTHDVYSQAVIPTYLQVLPVNIPAELKLCSVVILYEELQPDEVTQQFLDLLRQQDKFLLSFNHHHPSPLSLLHNVMDVHRLRDRCVLAVVQVSTSAESRWIKSEKLHELLKSLDRVIKKDEDYFIFHSPQGENIDALFKSGPVASGVKNKLGIKFSNSTTVSYWTTCFYCDGGNPSLHLISMPTSNSDGFHFRSLSKSILFPDLLKNFHGRQFSVSSPTLARWLNEIREISPGNWVNRRGVMNSALEHVMLKYNFTGKYFPSTGGGGTGYRYANGTWIGAVGDVLSGRADLGQTTGQVYNRNLVVGFSFPIVYEWLTFTTGKPQPYYSWKSVYWPLTPLVWLLVLGSLVATFCSITFMARLTNQRVSSQKTAIYLVRTFLEQDAKCLEPFSRSSVRMLLSFWLYFALLISTAYRSKLVSFLAFPIVEETPKTFKSLAQATQFQPALQYLRGAAYALLKTSPNPTFQAIYRRMQLEENDVKCFQQAIGTYYSCISWDSVADFVYHKNLSDKHGRVPLIKAPDTCIFIAVGVTYLKRAVFRTKFDEVISRAASMGLMGKWKQLDYKFIRQERRKWEKASNRPALVYEETLSDALTIQHLSGTFVLIMTGWCIGALVVMLEKNSCKWKNLKGQAKTRQNSMVLELLFTAVY